MVESKHKTNRDGPRFTSGHPTYHLSMYLFQSSLSYNNNDETISKIDLNILNKVLNHLNSDDELIFTLNNDKLDKFHK